MTRYLHDKGLVSARVEATVPNAQLTKTFRTNTSGPPIKYLYYK